MTSLTTGGSVGDDGRGQKGSAEGTQPELESPSSSFSVLSWFRSISFLTSCTHTCWVFMFYEDFPE